MKPDYAKILWLATVVVGARMYTHNFWGAVLAFGITGLYIHLNYEVKK